MKTFALCVLSLVLVVCAYADSPAISVKSKSKIAQVSNSFGFSEAVNTATHETLVTWSQNVPSILFGALISPNGNMIGKTFIIRNEEVYGSSCAYNPLI